MDFPKNKRYLIRAVSFMYNDEFMYPMDGFGEIMETYDNLEDATRILKQLNHKAMQGISPEQYQPISYCYKNNNKESIALDAYLQKTFDHKLLVPSTYSDGMMVDGNYHFPNNLTEEQAWEIHKTSGIQHYALIEIEGGESGFWGIRLGKWSKNPGEWASASASKFNQETHEYLQKNIPLVYNSKEAVQGNIENLLWGIARTIGEKGIHGSFEELSEMPEVLKNLVEQNSDIKYDEANQSITFSWLTEAQFTTLNGLLKDKIIEVVPFPLAEVEAIETGWMPDM
ncbi:MAG: hypothetical protein AB8H03_15830 [Saprospiraceae bacterium]